MISTDEKFMDRSQGNKDGSRPLSAKVVEKKAGVTPKKKNIRPRSAKRNIIYAPSRKPDTSYVSRLRPAHIQMDKERLYDDNMSLKIQINSLQKENISLKTKMKQLEKEYKKKNEELEDIGYNEKSPGFKYMRLSNSLKQSIKDLRAESKSKDEEINKLKKNLRVSKVAELEIEIMAYKEECLRLRQTCEELIKKKVPETTLSAYPEENKNKDVIIANLKKEKQDLSSFVSSLQDENYKLKEKVGDGERSKKKGGRKDASTSIKLENQKLRLQLEMNLKEKQEREEGLCEEILKYKQKIEELEKKVSNEERSCKEWRVKAEGLEKKLKLNDEKKEKNFIEKSIEIKVEAGKVKKENKVQLIKFSEVSFYFKHIFLAMQLHRYTYTQLPEILLSKIGNKDQLLDCTTIINLFQNPPFTFKTKLNMHFLGQFLVQPHEDQLEESEIKNLKITASQAIDKIKANLPEWKIFDTQEEAQFDFDLGQLIQNNKSDLKSLCKKHDRDNTGIIDLSDFKSILNELNAIISPRLFEYMTLLFYSHDYEIEKVPYKNFIKAYGKPVDQDADHEIDEEKLKQMKNCLNQIAQSLIKHRLTVKEVFQYEHNFIYPENFIAGLEYLGLKSIDQEIVILILDQLQCENETENCISADEFEKIMEGLGVSTGKKSGRPSVKSFSSKGSSAGSGNLKRISLLESENYEYSEDSPDKFGISEVSPFASVSNVEYYNKLSPVGNDNSKTELEEVNDESYEVESEEKMEKIQLKSGGIREDKGLGNELNKLDAKLETGGSQEYEEQFDDDLSEDEIKSDKKVESSSSSSKSNEKVKDKGGKGVKSSSSSSKSNENVKDMGGKDKELSSSSSESNERSKKKSEKVKESSSSSSESNETSKKKSEKVKESSSSSSNSYGKNEKFDSKSSEKGNKLPILAKDSGSSGKENFEKKEESVKEYDDSFSSDKYVKIEENKSKKSSEKGKGVNKSKKSSEVDEYSSDKSQKSNKSSVKVAAGVKSPVKSKSSSENSYSKEFNEKSLDESIKSENSSQKSNEKKTAYIKVEEKKSDNLIKHSDSSNSFPIKAKKGSSDSSKSKSNSSVSKEITITKKSDTPHSPKLQNFNVSTEKPMESAPIPQKSSASSKKSVKSSEKYSEFSDSQKFEHKSSSESFKPPIKSEVVPEFPDNEPKFPKLSSQRSSSSSSESSKKSESKSIKENKEHPAHSGIFDNKSSKSSQSIKENKEVSIHNEFVDNKSDKSSVKQAQDHEYKEEYIAAESFKPIEGDPEEYSKEFEEEQLKGISSSSDNEKLIEEFQSSSSRKSKEDLNLHTEKELVDQPGNKIESNHEDFEQHPIKSKSSKSSKKSSNYEKSASSKGSKRKDSDSSSSNKSKSHKSLKKSESSSSNKSLKKSKSSSSDKSQPNKNLEKSESSSSNKNKNLKKSDSSSSDKSLKKSKSSSSDKNLKKRDSSSSDKSQPHKSLKKSESSSSNKSKSLKKSISGSSDKSLKKSESSFSQNEKAKDNETVEKINDETGFVEQEKPLEEEKKQVDLVNEHIEEHKIEENLESLIKHNEDLKEQSEEFSQPENVSDPKKSSRKGSVSGSLNKGSEKYSVAKSVSSKSKDDDLEDIQNKIEKNESGFNSKRSHEKKSQSSRKHSESSEKSLKNSEKSLKSSKTSKKSDDGRENSIGKKIESFQYGEMSSVKSKSSLKESEKSGYVMDDSKKSYKGSENYSEKREKSLDNSKNSSNKSIKLEKIEKSSEKSDKSSDKSKHSSEKSKKSLKKIEKFSVNSEKFQENNEKSSKKSEKSFDKFEKSSKSSEKFSDNEKSSKKHEKSDHSSKSSKKQSSSSKSSEKLPKEEKNSKFSFASMMLGKSLVNKVQESEIVQNHDLHPDSLKEGFGSVDSKPNPDANEAPLRIDDAPLDPLPAESNPEKEEAEYSEDFQSINPSEKNKKSSSSSSSHSKKSKNEDQEDSFF